MGNSNELNSELGRKLDRVVTAIEANAPKKEPDVTPATPATQLPRVGGQPAR